jgi:prefoldin subunit 4
VGDCFVSLNLEDCQTRIEDDQTILNQELDQFKDEIDSLNGQMAKLKALLYGKFGNTINLEKD